MISLSALLLGALPSLPPADLGGNTVAYRVGEAHTVSHGVIPHAVILVENDEIVVVGQDLEIERGIPVIDRPDWVAIPGLVSCNSRVGLNGSGHSGSTPEIRVVDEIYPRQDVWADMLELGVTTLGLTPSGSGIPGQACAVRPRGDTVEEMLIESSAYLQMTLVSNANSKKMFRDGFEDVDKYLEKELKAYEKWEKKNEKKKDKEKEKYDPPQPDDKVVPFMRLREGDLSALIRINKASDWLHLLDVAEDEEFEWSLIVGLRDDIDLHYVIDAIGERETRVVVNPRITFMPNTRRERNLPADLARAGAKLAFVPLSDSVGGHDRWRRDVGILVASGLDANTALRAMTLEPAAVLRVDDQVGSIEAGKKANLVFLNGNPFEPGTEIEAVMLEGELVSGETH